MSRLARLVETAISRAVRGQSGLTMTEVLVAIAINAVVASTMAMLVGGAVQSKMISSIRSANTETTRETLALMTERLRNAGLNLLPNAEFQVRCKDRIVAQDPGLQPTTHSVYVSGEMLKTNAIAGAETLTIGYYVAPDPDTGKRVVMEYKQPCASEGTSIPKYSARLSNPRLNVTDLTFQYFDAHGMTITSFIGPLQIRRIAAIKISLTVEGSEGASGAQTQTLARTVLLWNPEPNTNNWMNANESY